MGNKAIGFTKAQRLWFLERDGHQCMMVRVNSDGKWHRCKNTEHLQVHHVIPRGWASMHYPKRFKINGPGNGITLCRQCHVGYGLTGIELEQAVHPDTEQARIAYRKGDTDAYHKMMDRRRIMNHNGQPYWVTQYDASFLRLIAKANGRYFKQKGSKTFPKHSKYGCNGR